jgi:hypothetical protein
MKNVVLVLAVEAFLLVALFGWQVGASYLHNYELNDDMTALAIQARARSGMVAIANESELRSAVLDSAKEYGIELQPEQVKVQETLIAGTYSADGTLESPGVLDISLQADYDAPVKLIGTLFSIHFAPMASHRAPIILK